MLYIVKISLQKMYSQKGNGIGKKSQIQFLMLYYIFSCHLVYHCLYFYKLFFLIAIVIVNHIIV